LYFPLVQRRSGKIGKIGKIAVRLAFYTFPAPRGNLPRHHQRRRFRLPADWLPADLAPGRPL